MLCWGFDVLAVTVSFVRFMPSNSDVHGLLCLCFGVLSVSFRFVLHRVGGLMFWCFYVPNRSV